MIDLHKPVTRRSSASVRDAGKVRLLVVTIGPGNLIALRPAGTRRREYTTLDAVYALAMRQRIIAERADKARAKKARAA